MQNLKLPTIPVGSQRSSTMTKLATLLVAAALLAPGLALNAQAPAPAAPEKKHEHGKKTKVKKEKKETTETKETRPAP
jgi:Ni/Co efflux regulator RcnB